MVNASFKINCGGAPRLDYKNCVIVKMLMGLTVSAVQQLSNDEATGRHSGHSWKLWSNFILVSMFDEINRKMCQ